MQTVKVERHDLLAKIKANREGHRNLFLKAQEGYRVQVINELDQMLADATEGKPIKRAISLPEPIDHTKDYDRVIAMLEMSKDDIIEIRADEFDMYVLDNWSWKELAMFTNTRYTG